MASLLQQLREHYPTLPAAQQRVIELIERDPQAAIGATVEQLAQGAGVSMPTIVRTCRTFGFSNVREFMVALAQDIALGGSYLHRSVLPDDAPGEIVSKIVRAATASRLGAAQNALRKDALWRCTRHRRKPLVAIRVQVPIEASRMICHPS